MIIVLIFMKFIFTAYLYLRSRVNPFSRFNPLLHHKYNSVDCTAIESYSALSTSMHSGLLKSLYSVCRFKG